MRFCTSWYRQNKIGFEFNHVEDDWATGDKPSSKFDDQRRNWNGAKWKKELGYFVGSTNKVMSKSEVFRMLGVK